MPRKPSKIAQPESSRAGAPVPGADRLGRARHLLGRLSRNRAAVVGGVILIALAVVAVAGASLAPHSPSDLSYDILRAPSRQYPMGTDNLGRDVLSRVMIGARATLLVGIGAAAVSVLLGGTIGAIAGYRGGRVDMLLMRLAELFQIFPSFFLAILVVAVFGVGVEKVILVLGIVAWPGVARVARGQFMSLKEESFVEAGRMVGLSSRQIVLREMWPNALPPVVVQASFNVAQAILVEASLGFLGLSDPTALTWGAMLQDAQRYLVSEPWVGLFPGVAILITVMSLNLLGDGINDLLNPKRKLK